MRDGSVVTLWTPEGIEERLKDAMATLRRLPFPKHGAPPQDRSHWPEIVRDAVDRAGWIIDASPEHLREMEVDRNHTRIIPSIAQTRDMDEALTWLHLIRDRRHRKIVFARSHRHEESGRHMTSYAKLGRVMSVHPVTLKRWYRSGIKAISQGLNDG